MSWTLDDLLLLIDRTILNPAVSAVAIVAVHFLTSHKLGLVKADTLIPYRIAGLSNPVFYRLLQCLCFGLVLRGNRFLTRKALNNGVKAKFTWEKEIIVVTGGSGGIGAQAAQKLATKGSKVVVLDVMPLTYTCPKNLHYYKVDLTKYSELQSVAEKIRKEVGEPTCCVANAGICRGKSIFDATPQDIELTFGVNSFGLLWTAKTFLPDMARKNHGHFLIIASQTGYLATAGVVDYASTKAAAISIYEGLQSEMKHIYKAPAVRISCISPSVVNTKMFAGINAPSNFVMPQLTPEGVGSIIAETLWSGEAKNIMCPAFAYISPPTRALPDWLRVGMQDGGAEVMSALTPHNPMA